MLKVSPDAKQLCVTCNDDMDSGSTSDSLRFFQIFDFDNATGKISNPRTISNPALEQSVTCEYSPDSKFLYVNGLALERPNRCFLEQFEAKLATEAEIIASRTRMISCTGTTCNNDFGACRPGPDGKIYLNRNTSKLSMISRPNVKAPGCQLEMDKIGSWWQEWQMASAFNDQ